jgi:hypothetical protein
MGELRVTGAEDDVVIDIRVDLLLECLANIDLGQYAEPFGLECCSGPFDRLSVRHFQRGAETISRRVLAHCLLLHRST